MLLRSCSYPGPFTGRCAWSATTTEPAGRPGGPSPAGFQRHKREHFLGIYGALSMVTLFAAWASSLIVGFGLLFWALRAETQTTLPISSISLQLSFALFAASVGRCRPVSPC